MAVSINTKCTYFDIRDISIFPKSIGELLPFGTCFEVKKDNIELYGAEKRGNLFISFQTLDFVISHKMYDLSFNDKKYLEVICNLSRSCGEKTISSLELTGLNVTLNFDI